MRREKVLNYIIVCTAFVLVAGCSAPAPVLPGCDSAVTLDLVREIIQRELDVSPEGFTTELVEASAGMMGDEEREGYRCVMLLTLEETHERAATQQMIVFTVHRPATDATSFAVNVYGLPLSFVYNRYGTAAIPSGSTGFNEHE